MPVSPRGRAFSAEVTRAADAVGIGMTLGRDEALALRGFGVGPAFGAPLTRAASELSRWDETVALAQRTPPAEALSIVRVSAAGPDRVAFLTDAAQAAAAATAVLDTVSAVRRQR